MIPCQSVVSCCSGEFEIPAGNSGEKARGRPIRMVNTHAHHHLFHPSIYLKKYFHKYVYCPKLFLYILNKQFETYAIYTMHVKAECRQQKGMNLKSCVHTYFCFSLLFQFGPPFQRQFGGLSVVQREDHLRIAHDRDKTESKQGHACEEKGRR